MQSLIENARAVYAYSLPLIISEFTHRGSDDKSFFHFRRFPNEKESRVVMMNSDTLYSLAFTQLLETPYIIHIPTDIPRYYVFPVLNAYTEVIYSIGTRTPEFSGGNYIFLYRDAPVPQGYENYKVLRSTTSLNSIFLRIETRGSEDYALVHRIQDSITIKPLYEERIKPVKNTDGRQVDKCVASLTDEEYYTLFARLIVDNPIDDDKIAAAFELFGYNRKSGKFDYSALSDEQKTALRYGRSDTHREIADFKYPDGRNVNLNGWTMILSGIGRYHRNYMQRAYTAWSGWGANITEDSVYCSAFTDSNYSPLESRKKYKLHIKSGEYPRAAAFWSISLYALPSRYLAENEINRHKISNYDVETGNVQKNDDGSLDIYIIRETPTDEKQLKNWLPASKDENAFLLVIRIYVPDQETLEGKWTMPTITEIERKN